MSEQHTEAPPPLEEVLHNEGATPLFLAIEETDWRAALDLAQANPRHVCTWVRSTGTENTTFEWSMWRRLPIHEACKRAAPAWLVAALLSTFPESAYMTTQLGELPLHLAVDSCAAPEVVNLIIVANWGAIVTPDQSGRIPTDILDRNELLLLDDHRILHESLTRCHKAYTDFQKAAHEEQVALKRKHKSTFSALSRRFEQELRREQVKQDSIRQEVRTLESKLEDTKQVNDAKDHQIDKFQQEKDTWMNRIASLEGMVEQLQQEVQEEKLNVNDLILTVKDKDAQIGSREEHIEILCTDLCNIAVMHDGKVMESVLEAERTMRAMVSSQIGLQKHLVDQSSGLKALLKARGISMAVQPTVYRQEEKDAHVEDEIDPNEAASALAAAASAALQKTPATTAY